MGISRLKRHYGTETLAADIDFNVEATKDVVITMSKPVQWVLRGRLYVDDPLGGTTAFSAWATYTFYNKLAKHGTDAFYRSKTKIVYTQLEAITPLVPDTDITPDDQSDFSPNDLALIIDSVNGNEHIRLKTILNTMTAEDSIGTHDINNGLSKVSEFSGFNLYNNELGNDIYLRVAFAAVQTISLKIELILSI